MQLEALNKAGILMHASEVFCIRSGMVRKVPENIVNDDAYMAVETIVRGYRIEFVPDSRVRIFGPQTVADHLLQRRRIVVGHYQVRKTTGRFSQYLFYSLITRPLLTLNTLVRYLASDRHRPPSAIVTAVFEVAANLLAFSDIVRRRSYTIWPILLSSKTSRELSCTIRAGNVLALTDIARGRSYVKWPIVPSTKTSLEL